MIARRCPHTGDPLAPLRGLEDDFAISAEGVVYYTRARALDYGPDYFLTEYSAQYGRSYLDDEEALRSLARSRLELLRGHLPPPASILEIGCAAGFFLDEARAAGYEVRGVEISAFAQQHASEKLGLDVRRGSFPETTPPGEFDCVAAFYVLEHFPNQAELFAAVAARIKPGGTLLAALPSTHGPLFRTNRRAWGDTHPADHFADYSPRSLARVLPRYGLDLVCARPASFHPERMRGRPYWRWFPGLYRRFATWRAFGDTLEFVARRR